MPARGAAWPRRPLLALTVIDRTHTVSSSKFFSHIAHQVEPSPEGYVMRRLLKVVAGLAVLLALPVTAAAQASIGGTVRDSSGPSCPASPSRRRAPR